jgi:hypothetical protein
MPQIDRHSHIGSDTASEQRYPKQRTDPRDITPQGIIQQSTTRGAFPNDLPQKGTFQQGIIQHGTTEGTFPAAIFQMSHRRKELVSRALFIEVLQKALFPATLFRMPHRQMETFRKALSNKVLLKALFTVALFRLPYRTKEHFRKQAFSKEVFIKVLPQKSCVTAHTSVKDPSIGRTLDGMCHWNVIHRNLTIFLPTSTMVHTTFLVTIHRMNTN